MNNLKLLVCCHKDDIIIKDEPYLPIHVGKASSPLTMGIQSDDIGDNISSRNPSFCELTGMYWAWKNLKNVDYIGLCHYRRYFDFHGQCSIYDTKVFDKPSFEKLDINIPDDIVRYLNNNGIILPRARHMRMSLYADYCCMHYSRDLIVLKNVIEEMRINKYIEAFKSVVLKNNKLRPYNMFIVNWNQFNDYCEWLFEVLFEVEKRIDISKYDTQQKRIFGYFGERLLNVYAYANKLVVKEYPVISVVDDAPKEKSVLRYLIRNGLNDIAMSLVRTK